MRTTTTFTIVVNKEDASLEYSGDVFKNATTSTPVKPRSGHPRGWAHGRAGRAAGPHR
jgi:hypothetical protein